VLINKCIILDVLIVEQLYVMIFIENRYINIDCHNKYSFRSNIGDVELDR